MRRPAPAVVGALLLTIGMAASAATLAAGDQRYPTAPETNRLLYVRSGATARRMALSFKGLAADVYWIRTIQHFGRDLHSSRTTGRFELLQPLLGLTTSLDPYFNIAYRFGALFLAMPQPSGAGRVDEAVALLERGLAASPTRWQYAYDAGFAYYLYAGDYRAAGEWFTKAAAMPGAPDWLHALAATTVARGGDRAFARRLLHELAASDQAYLRKDATRGLAQIDALDALDQLNQLIADYHATTRVYPASWADLIRAGRLPGVPADETHAAFIYDAAAHVARLNPSSTLAPLPVALGR
jgi:tetratricopeptide (TPR) repeat protein